MKVVLASGNKGKVSELTELLKSENIEVLAQSAFHLESPEETGLTFIENALIKARFAAEKTGLPAIADDSGISVPALQGAPGIYSARYAGEAATDQNNVQHLLENMKDMVGEQRQAVFNCVLVYLRHAEDPTPIVCHGQWKGYILEQQSGEGGFGYDPVFWAPETQCSAAQLSKAEKNNISHRGKALALLLSQLKAELA
ncbi:MAG: RdgB/HAM1 family non-canonical purine NTP pyrophosphatase [Oleiphilus sp.]